MKRTIEICSCGHTKNQHNNKILGYTLDQFENSVPIKIEGHGDCKLCSCERFTWTENLVMPDSNIGEIRSQGITQCNLKCFECSDIDCPSHPINNEE